MKKFILLLSMILCINQIKSASLIGAARGVAGSIATSHPVITCTGLGLCAFLSGLAFCLDASDYLGKCKAERAFKRNGTRLPFFKNGIPFRFDEIGKLEYDWTAGRQGFFTPFTEEHYREVSCKDQDDFLSFRQYRTGIGCSFAVAAFSVYGIYRTVFC